MYLLTFKGTSRWIMPLLMGVHNALTTEVLMYLHFCHVTGEAIL